MHGAWYYAENGEPKGPFTLELLTQHLLAIREPECQLVWRHGLAKWTEAQEVPELAAFVSRPPPMPPLPQRDTAAPTTTSSLWTAFFSFNGRMGRTEYLAVLVASLVAFVLVAAVNSAADPTYDPLASTVLVVSGVILLWIRLASSCKRFHDYNRSGWNCIGLAVPFLNVYFFFELLAQARHS
jgi:uncharacterized membrane protein YhaH (DUF805 family)